MRLWDARRKIAAKFEGDGLAAGKICPYSSVSVNAENGS